MRPSHLILSISMAVLVTSAFAAQSRPDFSGAWISVKPEVGDLQKFQVKQDAVTLTETRGDGGEDHTLTYNLDGTETRKVIPSHGDKEIVILTSAKWDDSSLVLTTAMTYPAGNTQTIRQVWSLDGEKQLVAEITRRSDRDGAPPPKTVKVVYRKQ